MKQIIPFKKELPFKTKVSDITSISLEREINVTDEGIVSGVFNISGDYKMNEGSINREEFSFSLPFDITLDPRYDVDTVNADIEDFYYDVVNEDTLKVNIDLFVEAEYLPESETKEDAFNDDLGELLDEEDVRELPKVEESEDFLDKVVNKEENIMNLSLIEDEKENRENVTDLAADLFSNLDTKETYTTYYVYIVKEEDTVDKILVKYGVTKEDLENYNDIAEIKPGDKIIIPKNREE